MTLYRAFLTTEMERPALMFWMEAPSFWACFTEEFMKTVQRLPRSTGRSANSPRAAKLLHVIAQGLGEGLQKAAAARGAGFVEEDVADGTVLDLEALHVLAADVDDEVHIGHEVLGGGEVGHRLHQTPGHSGRRS